MPRAIRSDERRAAIARRLRALSLALVAVSAAAAAPGAPPDGRALYAAQCARCHGIAARGDGVDAALFVTPPGSLRDGYVAAHPAPQVVQKILGDRGQQLFLDPAAVRRHVADIEAVVAYLQRLPDIDWPPTDAGQHLFAERCAVCHGSFGRAGPDATLPPGTRRPRDLSDPAFQRATDDAAMAIAVRHGREGMPALTPRLSEEETRQAVAFVRLLSPGYVTYATYCAACHGDHGIGAGSFAESQPLPTVIFNETYFARADPEKLRVDASHMLREKQPTMPHFRGTLSEAEANAIVTYLKGLPAGG